MSPTTTVLPFLTVEQVPIDDLRPDPTNPRRISEEELDALERSLRQFGFVQPVVARREDGIVIGGHQRLVAARRLGLTSVPVICLRVSAEQARLLGLASTRSQAPGTTRCWPGCGPSCRRSPTSTCRSVASTRTR